MARLKGVLVVCYFSSMSTVVEIETAIEQLPSREFEELRQWLFRRDWPAADEDIAVPRSYQQKVLDVLDES